MTRRTQIVITASCDLRLLGLWAQYPPLVLYGLVLNRVGHRELTDTAGGHVPLSPSMGFAFDI